MAAADAQERVLSFGKQSRSLITFIIRYSTKTRVRAPSVVYPTTCAWTRMVSVTFHRSFQTEKSTKYDLAKKVHVSNM